MVVPKNGLVLIIKPIGGILTVRPDSWVVSEVKQLTVTLPIAKQRQQQQPLYKKYFLICRSKTLLTRLHMALWC